MMLILFSLILRIPIYLSYLIAHLNTPRPIYIARISPFYFIYFYFITYLILSTRVYFPRVISLYYYYFTVFYRGVVYSVFNFF